MSNSEFHGVDIDAAHKLPVVTEISATQCTVDVPIAPCRYCGYSENFHIPAYPVAEEDDGMWDSRVECPNCESTGPSACHDMDTFCESKDEARGRAVLAWNRGACPIISESAFDPEELAAEIARPDAILVSNKHPISTALSAEGTLFMAQELCRDMAKEYPAVDGWEPLDTMDGVLSQMSNMFAGFRPLLRDAYAMEKELEPLRALEAAIRSIGLPTIMVNGQATIDKLNAALADVDRARDGEERTGHGLNITCTIDDSLVSVTKG